MDSVKGGNSRKRGHGSATASNLRKSSANVSSIEPGTLTTSSSSSAKGGAAARLQGTRAHLVISSKREATGGAKAALVQSKLRRRVVQSGVNLASVHSSSSSSTKTIPPPKRGQKSEIVLSPCSSPSSSSSNLGKRRAAGVGCASSSPNKARGPAPHRRRQQQSRSRSPSAPTVAGRQRVEQRRGVGIAEGANNRNKGKSISTPPVHPSSTHQQQQQPFLEGEADDEDEDACPRPSKASSSASLSTTSLINKPQSKSRCEPVAITAAAHSGRRTAARTGSKVRRKSGSHEGGRSTVYSGSISDDALDSQAISASKAGSRNTPVIKGNACPKSEGSPSRSPRSKTSARGYPAKQRVSSLTSPRRSPKSTISSITKDKSSTSHQLRALGRRSPADTRSNLRTRRQVATTPDSNSESMDEEEEEAPAPVNPRDKVPKRKASLDAHSAMLALTLQMQQRPLRAPDRRRRAPADRAKSSGSDSASPARKKMRPDDIRDGLPGIKEEQSEPRSTKSKKPSSSASSSASKKKNDGMTSPKSKTRSPRLTSPKPPPPVSVPSSPSTSVSAPDQPPILMPMFHAPPPTPHHHHVQCMCQSPPTCPLHYQLQCACHHPAAAAAAVAQFYHAHHQATSACVGAQGAPNAIVAQPPPGSLISSIFPFSTTNAAVTQAISNASLPQTGGGLWPSAVTTAWPFQTAAHAHMLATVTSPNHQSCVLDHQQALTGAYPAVFQGHLFISPQATSFGQLTSPLFVSTDQAALALHSHPPHPHLLLPPPAGAAPQQQRHPTPPLLFSCISSSIEEGRSSNSPAPDLSPIDCGGSSSSSNNYQQPHDEDMGVKNRVVYQLIQDGVSRVDNNDTPCSLTMKFVKSPASPPNKEKSTSPKPRKVSSTSTSPSTSPKPKSTTTMSPVGQKRKASSSTSSNEDRSTTSKKSKKQQRSKRYSGFDFGENSGGSTSAKRFSSLWEPVGTPTRKWVYVNNDAKPIRRDCYSEIRHKLETEMVIRTRDCIVVKSGETPQQLNETGAPSKRSFIAKVAEFFVHPSTGTLWVSLAWYYWPEQAEVTSIDDKFTFQTAHPKELLASRHIDCVSVDSIEELAYVVTLNEYNRYVAENKAESIAYGPCSSSTTDELASRASGAYFRRRLMPAEDTEDGLVFFCRRVYDFHGKKILRNPSF